jgi:hypothetical protein
MESSTPVPCLVGAREPHCSPTSTRARILVDHSDHVSRELLTVWHTTACSTQSPQVVLICPQHITRDAPTGFLCNHERERERPTKPASVRWSARTQAARCFAWLLFASHGELHPPMRQLCLLGAADTRAVFLATLKNVTILATDREFVCVCVLTLEPLGSRGCMKGLVCRRTRVSVLLIHLIVSGFCRCITHHPCMCSHNDNTACIQ